MISTEPLAEPLDELIQAALRSRPALSRSRIGLANSDISLRGIKNALKPSLDLVATATNNGLAGSINPDIVTLPGDPGPDPFFVGGLGNALGQAFRRNFPDYGVRLSLNVPLRNRQAQADMSRELLRRRKQDIQLRQQENAIKLEVSRAVATLEQERENYRIAVEARELYEQMAEAERKRFSARLVHHLSDYPGATRPLDGAHGRGQRVELLHPRAYQHRERNRPYSARQQHLDRRGILRRGLKGSRPDPARSARAALNFLAHVHLSRHDDKLLVGQMLGDFLEPGWRDRLPPGVVRGVNLHHRVDRFADTHPIFSKSRKRLGDEYRLYGGVMVDVFYDHFLAVHWDRYHPGQPLPEFTSYVYEVLARHEGSFTARFRKVFPSMSRHDWLGSYGSVRAIDRVLLGISRRLSRANPMAEGGKALRRHYTKLEKDFHEFFPELEAFVRSAS